MDNIEVAYAKKGLHVINTPAASSESVANWFLHIYLQDADFYKILIEKCQFQGQTEFAKLKNLTKRLN